MMPDKPQENRRITPSDDTAWLQDAPQCLVELLEWNNIVNAELIMMARGISGGSFMPAKAKSEEGTKAPRDTKNFNKGQFIGPYSTTDDIRVELPKKKIVLKYSRDIVKLVTRSIANQEREYVLTVSITSRMEVSNIRIVSIGSRNGARFNPADIFRGALLDDAGMIAIVHNHPSGDITPSKLDKRCLKCLMKIGKILDITIIDALIVGGKNWCSFLPGRKRK